MIADNSLKRLTACISNDAENQGNIIFRQIVQQQSLAHIRSPGGKGKAQIAQKVLAVVKARKGRFVKKVKPSALLRSAVKVLGDPEDKDFYVIVDEATAIDKIKQALRFQTSRLVSKGECKINYGSAEVRTPGTYDYPTRVEGRLPFDATMDEIPRLHRSTIPLALHEVVSRPLPESLVLLEYPRIVRAVSSSNQDILASSHFAGWRTPSIQPCNQAFEGAFFSPSFHLRESSRLWHPLQSHGSPQFMLPEVPHQPIAWSLWHEGAASSIRLQSSVTNSINRKIADALMVESLRRTVTGLAAAKCDFATKLPQPVVPTQDSSGKKAIT